MTVRIVARRTAALHRGGQHRAAGESGQLAILVIGYLLLSLLAVSVVTAASAVYLEHKRLLSVADSASAFAADSFSLGAVGPGSAPQLTLSDPRVRAVVRQYLQQARTADDFDRLAVSERTGSPDSRSATVVLTAVVRLPVVGLLLPDGVEITATSTSRPQLRR